MTLVCPSHTDWRECCLIPASAVHHFIDDEAQVDEEEEEEEDEEEDENGVSSYRSLIQCPWWVYPDFIDDNCEGQPPGTKTWRQYQEEEDGMDEFLDAILCHANNSRRQDDSQSFAILHPVAQLLAGKHQFLPGDYLLWHIECQVGCSERLQGGRILILDFSMAWKRMLYSPYFN